MTEPRLSICIATFNRASYIGETLDCLIAQLTDDVEIVVLDGGSSDGTERILREYAITCSRLRYFRQSENRGVDRDFDRVVELARGEYCWLMTDDDLLKPGTVSTVLAALQRQYSLVIVNAEVRNADLSCVIEQRRLCFDAPRTYAPGEMNRLFAETGDYLSFIGCVVIRRDIWLERLKDPYYGSLFIHVGVIFQRELPGGTYVIADPLISIRYGVAMWRPKDFEVWMFKWPSLVWSLPAVSTAAKAAIDQAEPWRNPRRLLFLRAKGTYGMDDYRRWIAPRAGSHWCGFVARAIARLPGAMVNVIALFYFLVIDRKQGILIADTKSSRFYYRNWIKWRRLAQARTD
jgi:abequosyltransferase